VWENRRPHRVAHPPLLPDHVRHRGRQLCQLHSGPIETIRQRDRVFFEPGEDHWHGAAPDRLMTHLALQEVDDEGSPVT
jgi:quercetin dioxygenase-like cupin family protein